MRRYDKLNVARYACPKSTYFDQLSKYIYEKLTPLLAASQAL